MAGDHGSETLGGLSDLFEFRGDVGRDDEGMTAPSGEGWPQQGVGLCLPGRDQWVEQLGGQRLIDADHEDAGWSAP